MYTEYLAEHVRSESASDALQRALQAAIDWAERTGNPDKDFLRYGNENMLCHAVATGRVTSWVLYNCESGTSFLERINPEQVAMIWSMIDADFWSRRFRDYAADREYVKEMLCKAGW